MKTKKMIKFTHLLGIVLMSLFTTISFQSFSQTAEMVTFANLNDPDFVSNYKLTFDINGYETKDGSILKVGSELMIGKPFKNELRNDNYPYNHWQELVTLGKIKGLSEINNEIQGEPVTIIEMEATSLGISKKSVRFVNITVVNTKGKKRYLTNYEDALTHGEVSNPNAALTRDEAIQKLKDAKDLFELGMYTEQQYDSVKNKLSPIIMGKN